MTNDERIVWLAERSIEVIEEGQGPTGGFLASPTFPQYRYSWFRDGAFIADAMSRAGRMERADSFFQWCARVVSDRSDQVSSLIQRAAEDGPASIGPDEHLHARYTLDGAESTDPWWTFQLDGYGTWLWALREHMRRGGSGPADPEGVALTAEYLTAFWKEPSYDWWEENIGHVHTATLGAIWAGLDAVAGMDTVGEDIAVRSGDTAREIAGFIRESGVVDGRLSKWIGSEDIDASVLSCIEPFRLFPAGDTVADRTIAAVEQRLTRGGVYRYPTDTYYGGGEWVLLAGFLGLCVNASGRRERALELLTWMADQADEEGHLPEQVDSHMLYPERRQEWIERWGPSARPLLWSHAMFLTLAIETGVFTPEN